MKEILIVEDDSHLGRGLGLALRSADVSCRICSSIGAAGEQRAKKNYALIILDINLPDGNGMDFLREIKTDSNTPVILLTANDTEMDIVAGLEGGADDYITKPFSLAVLRARVQTQLRRKEAAERQSDKSLQRTGGRETSGRSAGAGKSEFCFGAYRFCFDTMEFFCGERAVELSKTEQKLLRILVENAGITLNRGALIDRIWTDGAEYVDENALSVTVKRLRDKLDASAYIKTVYGIGYTWKWEET